MWGRGTPLPPLSIYLLFTMTYDVFGGTLSLTQSINQSLRQELYATACPVLAKMSNGTGYHDWIFYSLM